MYCCWAANSFEICALRASAKLCSAMAEPYRARHAPYLSGSPAEAGLVRRRLERAGRQPRLRAGGVVAGGRHVVRRVRMEERGEVLDLPAAGPELPLAAAVGPDALLGAVVVGLEQRPERTEP